MRKLDTMPAHDSQRIERDGGVKLAFLRTAGRAPTAVFLPGYKSDMTGAKALETEAFCLEQGLSCLRLDYSGHGASGGRFGDGSIGRRARGAMFLVHPLTNGAPPLIGWSMGGWTAPP